MERPWVTTEEGRASFIGFKLECSLCDEGTDWDGDTVSDHAQHGDGAPDGSP